MRLEKDLTNEKWEKGKGMRAIVNYVDMFGWAWVCEYRTHLMIFFLELFNELFNMVEMWQNKNGTNICEII